MHGLILFQYGAQEEAEMSPMLRTLDLEPCVEDQYQLGVLTF